MSRSGRRSSSLSRWGEGREQGQPSILLDASKGGPGAKGQGAKLKRLASGFLAELGLTNVELSLALVRDAQIRKLNRDWREKDKATDVLSFPAGDSPEPGPRPLGDVIISMDTARRAAREFGTTLERELALYLAHGLLHLLGHDHHEPREARKMERLERRLLGHAGMLARSDEV